MSYLFRVRDRGARREDPRQNGEAQEAELAPRLLLVHWLRDELGLTGTHIGCETSLCGAFTICW